MSSHPDTLLCTPFVGFFSFCVSIGVLFHIRGSNKCEVAWQNAWKFLYFSPARCYAPYFYSSLNILFSDASNVDSYDLSYALLGKKTKKKDKKVRLRFLSFNYCVSSDA